MVIKALLFKYVSTVGFSKEFPVWYATEVPRALQD